MIQLTSQMSRHFPASSNPRDKKRESDEVLKAAEAQQDHLQEALTCARKVLKESNAIVKSRGSDQAMEEYGLQNINDVRDALEFLREYVAPAPEEVEESQQVLTESIEEMPVDQVEEKAAAFEEKINPIITIKAKEIDDAMNVEDVPSPAKKARQSLGANIPTVVV